MEWHQIQYFQVVAKTQHITRAAEQLSISQPALSRAISKLEDDLGVQLFDRKGRNIKLNQYGKMFLNRVERSINEIEIGKQEIRDAIHPDHGTVSLAFLHSLGISFVPEIVSSFQNKFPDVKFCLNQAATQNVLEQIQMGEIDVALISDIQNFKEIIWKPLLTEELFLIVSIQHPLAKFDEVDLNEISEEPFIAFKNGYGMRTIIDNLCDQAGFSPKVVFEGEEIGTVAGLVAAKLGVSLVPDMKVLDKAKVKLLRIKNPKCSRVIGIAWRQDRYLSPVTKRFIQYVENLSIKEM
ncbi:LysR family transcriptional regulator [Heyndrickxia sp. NPDC080065]|uniref:LysR family transcriptional regulator n=1 Tax=Heyndrickxia sp. NPDC080065 TaxID=3390568 RepID=UPI003D060FC7